MSTNNKRSVRPDYDNGQCAICLSPQTDKSRLICGHVFCFTCITNWCKVKMDCPMCKQAFNSIYMSTLPSEDEEPALRYGPELPVAKQGLLIIPIDGRSASMDQFTTNGCEFVRKILSDYRHLTDKNGRIEVTVRFSFWNIPTDKKLRQIIEGTLERLKAATPFRFP